MRGSRLPLESLIPTFSPFPIIQGSLELLGRKLVGAGTPREAIDNVAVDSITSGDSTTLYPHRVQTYLAFNPTLGEPARMKVATIVAVVIGEEVDGTGCCRETQTS
jgi:hypothetical protein